MIEDLLYKFFLVPDEKKSRKEAPEGKKHADSPH